MRADPKLNLLWFVSLDQFFVEKVDRHTYICERHFLKNQELDWRKNPNLEPIPHGSNPFGSGEVTKIGKFKYSVE
mgnify:CR=1 FL=1